MKNYKSCLNILKIRFNNKKIHFIKIRVTYIILYYFNMCGDYLFVFFNMKKQYALLKIFNILL